MSAAMLALVCANRQVVAAQLRPALSRGTATTACSKPLSAEHWGKNSSRAQTACFAHVARTRQPHPSSRATRGGGGGGGREWVPCSVSGTGGRDGDGDGLDADGLEKKTATMTTEKFAGPIREMLRRERLFILETNIDDLSPQVMAYAMEELMAAGGLDVWAVPILMKKGRPGTKINVLCEEEVVDTMIRIILTETSSLGVRVHNCERVSMERDTDLVGTRWGHSVRVKVGRVGETIANVHAEYEDCAKVARAEGVPLKQVFREALDAYYTHNPVA